MLNMTTIGTCTEIKKKTKTKVFKDIKVGDKMEFTCPIQRAGQSLSGSTYAAYIVCKNLQTGETNELSFNQIAKVLENFTFTDDSDDSDMR